MRKPVITLRDEFAYKRANVTNEPGCYKWWFCEECVGALLNQLPNIENDRLIRDGNGFVALYIGIAKDLDERAKWHICQRHTISNVREGTLSTLRQTISALRRIDMTQSEKDVDEFMDNNCEWEWVPAPHRIIAEAWELQELAISYYPLNIQENYVVDEATKARLKELRRLHKK